MRIRKLLLSLVVLLAFSALARAQAGNTVLLRFVGAPTGTCAPIMVAVNNATGAFYDCLSGSWTLVGGGGGAPGTVTSVAQTVPSGLAIAGSPITTSGTLAITWSSAADQILLSTASNTAGFATVPTCSAATSALTYNVTTHAFGCNTITPGTGTVTSVGQTFTGGLISVAGSPVTTSGTLALTVAGTSGGIPYFDSATSWLSTAALTANSPMLGGGAGVAPSTKTFLTTNGTTTLTVGVAAGGNGILALGGNTSGTATFTAPAIAGTTTNAVAMSNALSGPDGALATPVFRRSTDGNTGLWFDGANNSFSNNGAYAMRIVFDGAMVASSGVFGWGSTTPATTRDTGLSRDAAGVVDFGTGAAGSTAGSWKATAGTLSGSLIVGGGTAITKVLSAAATLDFANLAAIGCEDLTITVTGAALSDSVALGIPNASVVANGQFTAWVSATNTVSVRFCTLVSGDPASGSFEATVFQN